MKSPVKILAAALAVAIASPVFTAPADHAPARGYRAKEARKFQGYTGIEWENDYGVRSGRCNTDTVLAAVGAAGGAVIGNRSASPENRTVATIVGALVGGLIGNEVGEAIDNRDRACMGHSLELAAIGNTITWSNPDTRVTRSLRPVRDLSGGCRRFEYRSGKQARAVTMTACRTESGWTVRER